jgi:hypothetical protein
VLYLYNTERSIFVFGADLPTSIQVMGKIKGATLASKEDDTRITMAGIMAGPLVRISGERLDLSWLQKNGKGLNSLLWKRSRTLPDMVGLWAWR